MSDLNHSLVTGHLTRDAESRTTPNGKTVTTLWIAVNEWIAGREETTFLKVACWGRTAETAATLGKGRAIYASGRLKFSQWEDRSGAKRSELYLNADVIKCLPGGAARQDGGEAPPENRDQAAIERQEHAADAAGRN